MPEDNDYAKVGDHIVCPVCGERTEVVHCKLVCPACRTLIENCGGD